MLENDIPATMECVDPNSEEQEIITRLRNLRTKSARHRVFHGLIHQLASDEWRDLRDHLNTRTFQCDILGLLPPEIAVQVAQYLDLAEIHVLQRVSRTWHKLLSSNPVRGAVYRRYSGRTLNFCHQISHHIYNQYAKQRIRLERGEPSSALRRREPSNISPACLDYSNGRYAWTGEMTTVVVQDLRSHAMQMFCTENRERIGHIRLSELVVAVVTLRGYCHVWNLRTEEPAYFRLPSRLFHLFVVRGTKVAFGFKDPAAGNTVIMQWDFNTRVSRTLVVADHLVFIDLHSTLDCLISVHLQRNDNVDGPWDLEGVPCNAAQLQVVKHCFDDSLEAPQTASKILTLPKLENSDWVVRPNAWLSEQFNDRAGILIARPKGSKDHHPHYIIAITHYIETEEVFLHLLPPEHTSSSHLHVAPIDRNLLYYIRVERAMPTIWISQPGAHVPYRPAKSMPSPWAVDPGHHDADEYVLKGDHDCVLLVNRGGVSAWCFDEAAQPLCAIPFQISDN
ncbi:hypothetical protein CNMCM6936_008217 [Aspergillus lentulus]|uniref:F-box domain-containing protein n=2 Tax=Aspergillus lentulus TaxID=293939 RepID=A0AAN6BRW3_ASPLE|nr:hypothetical protein CNMCM6936_008217 [Aspergillus lentulus]KAF4177272.1 hypothetical protein CNMCM8060_005667 [Aspergillus lentulus]KAF4183910.1 hypothetical protein CNMCM7927_008690 [Aspergillus lentulus]KAF4197335.1 hypothetical protein CNMCM8694_002966 [Aspergillus lentulus]KAF4207896.1 hypothetical protein CNMCM8927_001786 [Aspergillus lentulus]